MTLFISCLVPRENILAAIPNQELVPSEKYYQVRVLEFALEVWNVVDARYSKICSGGWGMAPWGINFLAMRIISRDYYERICRWKIYRIGLKRR